MKAISDFTTDNGLTFQDVIYKEVGTKLQIFVTCTDKHGRNKYYYGIYDNNLRLRSMKPEIIEIMEGGAKWKGMDDNGNVLL